MKAGIRFHLSKS